MPKAQGVGFFVRDDPYAVWEWDMPERNLDFIRGIEHGYFEYIGAAHINDLDGERRHLAALAIRSAYFHGIETLLTLLCAATFAPHCVPGWIQRCTTPELRDIVDRITRGSCIFPNPLGLEPVTWGSIAERVIRFADISSEERSEVQVEFSGLWTRLAHDWLQSSNVGEYNSIKHGLRIRPGGFNISVAPANEDGSEPSPEDMKWLGGSKFGSCYFNAEPIQNAPDKSRTNFRIRRHNTNWNPQSLCRALSLISGSICNVKSFLLLCNGDRASDVTVFQPENKDDFWKPWENLPGVSNATMDSIVSEEHIVRLPKEELAKQLAQKFEQSKAAPSS